MFSSECLLFLAEVKHELLGTQTDFVFVPTLLANWPTVVLTSIKPMPREGVLENTYTEN